MYEKSGLKKTSNSFRLPKIIFDSPLVNPFEIYLGIRSIIKFYLIFKVHKISENNKVKRLAWAR